MNFSKWGRASVLALTWGATSLGAPAFAQSASDDSSSVGGLVITAERRTQDLQTSAISATVLNAQTLEDKGVVNLTTLQYAAPGIQISDYSSANTFNIRGIGQSQVDIDLPSGVVIYRDGVPTLTGYFQNAPYYDMSGVEVLRGPQGTFVGKSAAAGAVFIRTRDPELGDFSGDLMVGAGNHAFFETTAILNAPITDDLAVRVAYHRETRGSLFDSIQTNPLPGGLPFSGNDDRDLDSLRIGLTWQPTQNLRAVWKLDLDDLDFGSHATSGFCAPVSQPGLCPAGFQHGLEEDVSNPVVNGEHGYLDRGARSSLNINYDFSGGWSIRSLTGYSTVTTTANWDSNGSNPTPSRFLSHGDFTNWSQEFDILSPSDRRIRWVGGLFWQNYLNHIPDYTQHGFELYTDDGPLPLLTTPWSKDETNYAIFSSFQFDLTDALELEVGARWGHYEFDQFTELTLFGSIPFLDPAGGIRQSYEEDSTDWKINLNYEASDTQFFYGLVSRGHSPGSINIFPNAATPTTLQHTAYDAMEVINYELGWKGAFFDRQLRTQLATYYQTFDGYQAAFAVVGLPPGAIASVNEFKNADTESTIWGVEFGAQGYFGNLQLDVAAAYSKSELGSFGTINNPFLNLFGGPTTLVLEGAATPFAPEWTANAGLAYTFHLQNSQIENGIRMTPRIDISYRGDSYANLYANRATLLEGQTLLSASLRFETDVWEVSFWGTNLTDERFAAAKQNVAGNDNGTPLDFTDDYVEGIVYMAPPRLFGVRIGRSF